MKSLRFFTRLRLAPAIAAATALLSAMPAWAEWPERAVTIVVPYGPGAANDLYARAVAQYLSTKFKQPFIVENRPGAAALVGTNQVVRADPDGYTFLEQQNTIASTGFREDVKDFDLETSLISVAMIARSPEAFLVTAAIPAKTPKEFFDYIKAHPDKAFYGIGGVGTSRHMVSDKLARMFGVEMKAVSYNSGAPILLDVSQGRTAFAFGSVSTAIAHIQAGTVRLLAYAGDGATPDSPKAPTFKELGVDFETYSWWGLWAPKGTPADIVNKMNAAVNEAIQTPEFVKFAAQSGATSVPMKPAEFQQVVKAEVDRVRQLIKETGLKPQ